jgi:hypothetical protein
MAIDPNIALGVRPIEIANPLAQYNQLAQIQNAQNQNIAAQNQNALAQFQLGSAQRTEKSQNLLADAYAQSTDPATGKIDYNKLTGLVAAGGGGAQIPGIQKSRFEQETTNTKLLADKLALLPTAYKMADTPDAYLALHQSIHADPVLGPYLQSVGATPEKGLATLQKAIQTGKFEELRIGSMQSVSQILDSLKPVTLAASSSVYNPQTGTFNQAPAAPEKPPAPPSMVAEFNFAKTPEGGNFRGDYQQFVTARAAAGRAPAAPRAEAAPVAVVDPVTGKPVLVTREQSFGMTPASAQEGLPPKEIQKREAVLPQARQSVKTVNNTMSIIGHTVDKLLANPNGIDGITGLIGGVTPAITNAARAAKADLEQLKNLAFVQGLTELRNASKTGAGVGNVSNREGDRFENLKASLDRSQSKDDLEAALRRLKAQSEFTIQTMQEAFDETYSYKAAAPVAPQGTGGFKYLGKEGK